ncbi:MAG: GldG family protein [Treponema sp.]|jgi:ABC-type uncharacterized transport system involved in gliding motility auxiliary subunit|nr:GldG family protein [Treponema sp.]
MTKKQIRIITMLSVIAFILAILVSGRFWIRLDLTKSKAFTISQVSRNLHREIPDPVSITYFVSGKLRAITPIPGEIEDMLREYAAYSRGKIRLTVRDPLREMEKVEGFNLQPRQVPVVEQDQTSLVTVYSGIVIEYLDKSAVLPWIISTHTLEYDLTSAIRSMVSDTERWIGVIVGDNFRSWREDFSYFGRMLHDAGYRVRLIFPGEEIPDNTPGLLVLGGSDDLDYWALYRIDRYIQLGGKVLFAVKGVAVDTVQGTAEAWHHENPIMLDMIASYGVLVRPELALDRHALTLQYQQQMPNGWVTIRRIQYPLWIGVLEDNGNPEHPVTTGFNGLDLFWASPLEIIQNDDIEATVLFTSSPHGWSMRHNFYTSPELLHMMEVEANETRNKKILGASLRGLIPSFFRGAPKPERDGVEELPDMPHFASVSRIMVIGDVDFATDIIEVTQAGHNLDFLLRVVDWLVSEDDIISIRNRQPHIGRLDTKIIDDDQRAAAMRFVQVLNVIIIPLFVIAAGLIRASRRKRVKRLPITSESLKESSDV